MTDLLIERNGFELELLADALFILESRASPPVKHDARYNAEDEEKASDRPAHCGPDDGFVVRRSGSGSRRARGGGRR